MVMIWCWPNSETPPSTDMIEPVMDLSGACGT
jgi:hypothetical protein